MKCYYCNRRPPTKFYKYTGNKRPKMTALAFCDGCDHGIKKMRSIYWRPMTLDEKIVFLVMEPPTLY